MHCDELSCRLKVVILIEITPRAAKIDARRMCVCGPVPRKLESSRSIVQSKPEHSQGSISANSLSQAGQIICISNPVPVLLSTAQLPPLELASC